MEFIICLGALIFLMYVAYRGFSIVLFAPIAAMGAVLLTNPEAVATVFNAVFMDKLVTFVRLYFPVFVLGAIFGKVIELSGFSKSIAGFVIKTLGQSQALLAIILVCNILTYGGVSLFIAVFAVYPFAAEMFRAGNIPKRLIPGTIALGAFSYTMDSLPGTPQIQNVIPSSYFGTNIYAAPILGIVGSIFILAVGFLYLDRQRRLAIAAGEGYGSGHINEPETDKSSDTLVNPALAILPLIVVGVTTFFLSSYIKGLGKTLSFTLTAGKPAIAQDIGPIAAIWAVEGGLLLGIVTVLVLAFRPVMTRFIEGSKQAVAGAMLATMNTAAENGFGGVIAALPGFIVISETLKAIPNPLVNEAVSVTTLAGITGSASGGMTIALAALAEQFKAAAVANGIPMDVMHRVASMASGGMDTLPHNGAVITVLAVTGLTHKQSYKDIFAVTSIKTLAVFVVIAFYYITGLY